MYKVKLAMSGMATVRSVLRLLRRSPHCTEVTGAPGQSRLVGVTFEPQAFRDLFDTDPPVRNSTYDYATEFVQQLHAKLGGEPDIVRLVGYSGAGGLK